MELPSFLNVTPPSNAPRWAPPSRTRAVPSKSSSNEDAAIIKERILSQFETAFPRLMDQVYAGYTLHRAVAEYPFELDYGHFNRWVMKDPKRKAEYEQAKEYRTEVWADRMVAHAEGDVDGATIERSKYATDVYKFLMGKHNKKTYGEVKTLEVEHRISVTSALEQSRQRVIEATVIDTDAVLLDDEDEMQLLMVGSDEDEDDE